MTPHSFFSEFRVMFVALVLGAALPAGMPEAQAQPFTFTIVQADLTPLDYGAMAFADLDQDGDFDLVVGGNERSLPPFAPRAYVALSEGEARLPGGGAWRHRFAETRLPTPLWHSAVTWIDYDRDGDLDFVLAGTERTGALFENLPFVGRTRLYRNDGDGGFEEVEAGLAGVYSSTAARGDYDNDGDDDLLLTGLTDPDTYITRLYRNDGGTFEAVDTPFPDVAFGDAQWADYDNDGDLDLTLAGARPDGSFVTQLYRNDGGRFEAVDAGLRGLAFSSLDWADYDNDGDLDLALAGADVSLPTFFDPVAEVYRNDDGRLTRLDAGLDGILYGVVAWGDYDNDGASDLLLLGADNVTSGRTGRVYHNQDGAFVARVALIGVAASSAVWADYDDDADLDVLATGSDLSFVPLTRLYRNDQLIVNTVPAAPTGLQAAVQGTSATLSWQPAQDDQTPAAGLTYSLRVGTASGAANVVAPLADAATGQRWTSGRGFVDHNTRWRLTGLAPGTYFWSVQAVDASYKGSAFAEEGSFTINANTDVGTSAEDEVGLPKRFALHPGYPNPFGEATTLAYDLPEQTPVALTVYNVLGAKVHRLVEQVQPAGRHQVVWDGRDTAGQRVGAGVYFVQMRAGHLLQTRQLVVLR